MQKYIMQIASLVQLAYKEHSEGDECLGSIDDLDRQLIELLHVAIDVTYASESRRMSRIRAKLIRLSHEIKRQRGDF